jgi:hypothetical protein
MLFPYFYWLTRETPAIPTEFAHYGEGRMDKDERRCRELLSKAENGFHV